MTAGQWKSLAQVAQWLAEGKKVEHTWGTKLEWCAWPNRHQECKTLEEAFEHGHDFRCASEPKRRPFTSDEAKRLIGCVLVSPLGPQVLCNGVIAASSLYVRGVEGNFKCDTLSNEQWHYRLPGSDKLIPCWIEETV